MKRYNYLDTVSLKGKKRHKRTAGVSYKQGSYRASFRCFSSSEGWKRVSFLIIGLLLLDSSPPFSLVNPLEKGGVRNLALRENGERISLALPNSILGLSTINKPLRRRGPEYDQWFRRSRTLSGEKSILLISPRIPLRTWRNERIFD